MEITIIFDDMYNELYQVSELELIAKDEKFKLYQLVKGSYEFKGEVLRKDYKGIKEKNRKRGHYLVRFEREDKTIIKLVHQGDLEKEEQKQQKTENNYFTKLKNREEENTHINKAKIKLNETIKILNETIKSLNLEELEEIYQYNTYLFNVIEKLKANNLRDISTTKQINKNLKIELYKKEIHNYILNDKFSSINQLCKDLKINRKSLYNYGLNEYIKELKK